MRIVLFGGHGKVALLAEPLLAADGHQVTAVIRNPDHAGDVAATGAQPVVADVEDLGTEALAELVRGTDIIIWSAGAGGGDPARTRAVDRDAAIRCIDAAVVAEVPCFVMVSYWGAQPDHGVDPENPFWHYAEAKTAADTHLRGTELCWVILKPGRLTLEPAGGIYLGDDRDPVPGGVERTTSRELVAQVIAAVVDDLSADAVAAGSARTRRDLAFLDGDGALDQLSA